VKDRHHGLAGKADNSVRLGGALLDRDRALRQTTVIAPSGKMTAIAISGKPRAQRKRELAS
jgi:hypothetical protein